MVDSQMAFITRPFPLSFDSHSICFVLSSSVSPPSLAFFLSFLLPQLAHSTGLFPKPPAAQPVPLHASLLSCPTMTDVTPFHEPSVFPNILLHANGPDEPKLVAISSLF